MLWDEIQQFHQEHSNLLQAWRGKKEDKKGPKGPHCWGGILLMRLEGINDPRCAPVYYRFPNENTLAQALQEVNPTLGEAWAYDFACRIIDNNDSWKLQEAGQILKSALQFGQAGLLDRQLAEILARAEERKSTAA